MKTPTAVIREEIQKSGPIPFARFMNLALYSPETGYHERNQDRLGRDGDFITSVSVGSLFGELLAFQFAEWLEAMPEPAPHLAPLKIIEAGAHDGKLALDILSWLQKHRPRLLDKLEYHILETSSVCRQWQIGTLKDFSGKVSWTHSTSDFKGWMDYCDYEPAVEGIIFSNELLDAFPVNRVSWDAKARTWFEWGVTWDGEEFAWARLELQPGRLRAFGARIPQLPESLLEVLPDGYIIDTSYRAEDWWQDIASVLRRGKLLTMDCGYTDEELISPSRPQGTLRAYHHHQASDDLLACPGEQDLTAHVNFTAIQKAGEAAELTTEQLCSQAQFLTNILAQACAPSARFKRMLGQPVVEKYFARLDSKQIRQFQTLTHPDHFGRAFRVLVQSRSGYTRQMNQRSTPGHRHF